MSTAVRQRRETWRDWVPDTVWNPPNLMTSEELVDELNRRGLNVDVEDLRFWVKRRILPPAARQAHKGGNRGVYHPAYIPAVHEIRLLAANGWKLDSMRDRVRRRFVESAVSDLPFDERVAAVMASEASVYDPPVTQDVVDAIRAWSRIREQTTNAKTAKIEVSITGEDGRRSLYTIPVSE